MEETNLEEKNTIIQILSSTKWKNCDRFVKIRSMSNYIYLCSYDNTKIILRIYGQLNSHCKQVLNMNEPMEIISSYIIGKNELGPQLYMIFKGGRIEEYINDSVTLRELPLEKIICPELNRVIAQKLARFHSLNVPIPNDTMKVFETTKKIFESMFEFKHSLKTNFTNVWEWCAPLLCGICNTGGMVFSHYDFSLNNILIKKTAINQTTKHDDIMFVDFEYSCYGFGESDIATYFNTWDVDTSNPLGVLPYPKPTDEIKYNFVVDYLREKEETTNELI
ncbi:Choline/ ethanolamine kinase, (pKC-like) [Armadillidium vulgare iridescent virus]|uniref:Choline/ ethanolamine kinase, (PKC-like) n=1 Tax=Armadillidium vulgare iridescent virus TaxID=72201 RepID=A0A068QKX3_9VIRU|nr:Choline/ ethanolamine kinase, (pKC-like) [Armadillidium vulgare iridescent virus]CCV02508.1 Choline/ ethanolamine kinase, (pKC-like) [Armadillidium vulgare iridescent virus]